MSLMASAGGSAALLSTPCPETAGTPPEASPTGSRPFTGLQTSPVMSRAMVRFGAVLFIALIPAATPAQSPQQQTPRIILDGQQVGTPTAV